MSSSNRKPTNYVIGKKRERPPLQGYWDIGGPQYNQLKKRYDTDNQLFDPTNNEKQASQLIDLPTALIRNQGISTDYLEDKHFRYRDPYSDQYKNRLLNAWWFDPVINQAIFIRSSNILGKSMKTVLEADPYIILGTDVTPRQALNDIVNEEEQQKLMTYIKKVERLTSIYDKYEGLVLDYFIGGRSGKFMQPANAEARQKFDLPLGTPANLIDLEWQRLGQVKLDNNDNISKIEYRDAAKFPVNQDAVPEDEKGYAKFLPYNQMIYFTRNEKYYGRSVIQTILSVSEINRMLNEQDLPEIAKSRWAPSMLFWSKEMSIEELEDFIADRDPAKDSAVRAEIHTERLSSDADPSPLTELRFANARFMIMQLDVPSFLMKMEDVTNRATAAGVLATWRNLTLENDRTKFRQIMWGQFYKPLVELYMRQSDQTFEIINWDARIGFIFQNLQLEDDESLSIVVARLQKYGIETVLESRRRLNLPAEKELGTYEKVLANTPNANAIGMTKDGVQNLVGSAKQQMLDMMRRNGMPQAMIAQAENFMSSSSSSEEGTEIPDEEPDDTIR